MVCSQILFFFFGIGHFFTAFGRYSADDESVTECSLGQVLAAQAYILFYCSTVLPPYKS
jgi:hypothetical protein